jgi:hypothetical protein
MSLPLAPSHISPNDGNLKIFVGSWNMGNENPNPKTKEIEKKGLGEYMQRGGGFFYQGIKDSKWIPEDGNYDIIAVGVQESNLEGLYLSFSLLSFSGTLHRR